MNVFVGLLWSRLYSCESPIMIINLGVSGVLSTLPTGEDYSLGPFPVESTDPSITIPRRDSVELSSSLRCGWSGTRWNRALSRRRLRQLDGEARGSIPLFAAPNAGNC